MRTLTRCIPAFAAMAVAMAAKAGMCVPGGEAAAADSCGAGARVVHRIEADYATGGILHTNSFLEGDNAEGRVMNHASALRLKYAFQAPHGSRQARIYPGAYQGAGLALHRFNPQLGNPVSVFVFQGARIARLGRRLALNYEWNLGLAMGWRPYDREANPDNQIIGSRATAYLNADLYLCYRAAPWLDVNAGVGVAHFSNGNTAYPNLGLNTLAARLSAAFYPGRRREGGEGPQAPLPAFGRHVSYDLVVFGAWRRRGVAVEGSGQPYALPGTYGVIGLNFNPMYNMNHWFNAGLSLDAVYDRSANITFAGGEPSVDNIVHPPASEQVAVGLSARAEFVMPYFTINLGVGHNVIGARGDFSGLYQVLALKVNVWRGSFLHIGYCLDGFSSPNYLMLGAGYRFGGKRKW